MACSFVFKKHFVLCIFIFLIFFMKGKGDSPKNNNKHFVLVHGVNHGAWIWYKVKTLLQAANHRVTVLDLAASGINLTRIEDLRTLRDYSEPLIHFMASLDDDDQKVILVGHSYGGLNIALAMEMFPQKVKMAIFLSAIMPDTTNIASFTLDKFLESLDENFFLDSKFVSSGDPNNNDTILVLGPKFLAKTYNLSPREDLELAMTLIRPAKFFLDDLRKPEKKFTEERYGSIPRAYIITSQDQLISKDFQKWIINNYKVEVVKELKKADHYSMFSVPKQLSNTLLEIAHK
ncbi:salicylic acid-binding protein 2-like [Amaranthus tricolor]|uniref:salicylic acid-binding protein 2-like n=1 Tax=Amaranthus tricolor TaxID=29722 RepID=UPI0025878D42|nr:salicylic acid-binding protein 2-like [Amaranthus tricolor]